MRPSYSTKLVREEGGSKRPCECADSYLSPAASSAHHAATYSAAASGVLNPVGRAAAWARPLVRLNPGFYAFQLLFRELLPPDSSVWRPEMGAQTAAVNFGLIALLTWVAGVAAQRWKAAH